MGDLPDHQTSGTVHGLTPATRLDLRRLAPGQTALVLLRNALDRMRSGEVIEVDVPDGQLREDCLTWLRLQGHALLADLDAGAGSKLLARKQTPSRPAKADWGVRLPRRDGRAIDVRDWFAGRAGDIPDEAPAYFGFVPRGAVPEPGGPSYPYILNRKADVWSDNLPELYEQAKAQQWDASRDIEWEALPPMPEAVERAVCQIMTFLAENEYAALYVPAKFLPRINAQFVEPVLFLATIINDEARHIEAFTKRALANGGGLQYSSVLTERSLHGLLVQEDYFRSSFLLHVLGEGTFLDLLDFVERHAPDPVTADIVRRARLDEGRHVAYGIGHARHVLERKPSRIEELVAAAEERSAALEAASGGNPMTLEALAVLAGGGSSATAIDRGFAKVQDLFREMHEHRVRRMLQIGLDAAAAEKISRLHTPNFM
ncbi:MAG TPA: DUF455 domain-containing protein [Dehalococcoidia bacterium]|nr:DUF455 domain-containing protein [Dehalococcoidia bacterium]